MVVVLAALAGAAFGALMVAVRFGLDRGVDAQAGAAATAIVAALASVGASLPALCGEPSLWRLWPFFVLGLLAPGASQILLTLAVRHAGASRAAIVMGASPVLSLLIACAVRGEPFRPVLATGTGMIVLGGVTVAGDRRSARAGLVGPALALGCAALFAVRDNLLHVAATETHPSPLAATAATLAGAAAAVVAHLVLVDRSRVGDMAARSSSSPPRGSSSRSRTVRCSRRWTTGA
jgi:drug/metabolite transporter (DMT)-like permease